jgi:uncharacterized coiled-coil DUF342 family protein
MDLNKRIDEIIELLAEYLQKTDRILDRMDKHDEMFEKQLARIDLAYQVIITHSEKIELLQEQSKDLQQQSKDLRLEMLKQESKNETLLGEILSISRRVRTIEAK